MPSIRINTSWLSHQRIRLISPIKIILLIFILFFVIFHTQFFNKRTPWCDPAQPLWWFCPWPGPETVCSWNEHFPIINGKNRSPEATQELILSLPKLRSSFEFNNKTLIKCTEDSIDLLIFVISKCSHSSIRQSIRRTWGNLKLLNKYFPKLKLKLLFLVDIDSKSDKKIELEYFYHNDIVQIINLGEEYFYVTEREAALYQFINQRCQQTKYLFKTDDDIFLNTFLLLIFLKDKLNNLIKYSLFGFPIEYGLVIRHSNDDVGKRYIITKDEYLCSRYPTFLSGFGYLMSIETSNLFINSYLTDIKPFPLSDVYFTGLLSQMLNIKRETILENVDYHYQTTCNQMFFKDKMNPFVCAASNDHFNQIQTNKDKTLMNDYNLYWTILIERYSNFKISKK